jgi:2-dehydropantoate 2-reductase
MRFAIIGAGGIGAYYGALLHRAGHQVTLVARGAHLEALQRDGLTVHHPQMEFTGRVPALSQASLLEKCRAADFDLIAIAIKSGGTETLCAELGEWLATADTPVLSLQNGVDNELCIERTVGRERTVGGLAVRIGGHITAPGVVSVTGPAQVVMGAWPDAAGNGELQTRLQPLAAAFDAAGIPTTLSAGIQKELWRKLLINNGVNPLSALTGLDTRALTAHPTLGRTVHQMMQETAAVAVADGVELDPGDVDEMFRLISGFDAIKTSMLVDREKGRPLELEAIAGAVLRRAGQFGVETPCTATVAALLELSLAREDEAGRARA